MISAVPLLSASFAFKTTAILGAGRSTTVDGRVFEDAGERDTTLGSIGSHDLGYGQLSLPPQRHRRSQRDRLLHGMAETVARRGYAATPVAEVLKAAGVSRRTFYEQFADKEDCFLAAYEAFTARCAERVAASCRAAGEAWEESLADVYGALLRTLAAEPAFAHLAVVEVLAAGPRALARRDAALRRLARFIDAMHERADGVARPPRLVGQAIVGGMHELVYSQIVRGETERLPELVDDLLHYTCMLLGAPRPAA